MLKSGFELTVRTRGTPFLEHLLARFRGGALPKGYCNLYT